MSSDDSAIGNSTTSHEETTETNSTADNSHERRVSRNVTNPFELNVESLHSTAFSPSVFKTPVAKSRMNGSFQWSIEQRSRLMPATIDENFSYESSPNSDNEREIQKAIDKFWHANPLIAPSPDIVANRIMKPLTFTPSPDNVASCIKRTINPLNFTPSPIVPFTRRNSFRGLEDSPVSRASNGQTTRECQTDISIPLDFDLEDLLSKHLPPPQHASTPKFKKFLSYLDQIAEFESQDSDGLNMSLWEGVEVFDSEHNKHKATDVLKDKVVALYFSAGWCPPCRSFTPKLKRFYEACKAAGKNFEVVWVSRDREAEDLKEYYDDHHGPWYYLGFGDPLIKEWLEKFEVKTIPAMKVIKEDGTVVVQDARTEVAEKGADNAEELFEEWIAFL